MLKTKMKSMEFTKVIKVQIYTDGFAVIVDEGADKVAKYIFEAQDIRLYKTIRGTVSRKVTETFNFGGKTGGD